MENGVDPMKVIDALGNRIKALEIENAMLKVALGDMREQHAAPQPSTEQPQA